jgi:hypothetical protein
MCNQCNDSNQEHVHVVLSRREALIAGAALVAAPFLGGVTSIVQAAQAANTRVPVGRPTHAQAVEVRAACPDTGGLHHLAGHAGFDQRVSVKASEAFFGDQASRSPGIR